MESKSDRRRGQPTPAKEAAWASGMSYREIGQKIGITEQAVHQALAGETRSATTRYAIAHVLGRSIEELWPEDAEVGVGADGGTGE